MLCGGFHRQLLSTLHAQAPGSQRPMIATRCLTFSNEFLLRQRIRPLPIGMATDVPPQGWHTGPASVGDVDAASVDPGPHFRRSAGPTPPRQSEDQAQMVHDRPAVWARVMSVRRRRLGSRNFWTAMADKAVVMMPSMYEVGSDLVRVAASPWSPTATRRWPRSSCAPTWS